MHICPSCGNPVGYGYGCCGLAFNPATFLLAEALVAEEIASEAVYNPYATTEVVEVYDDGYSEW